MRCGHSAHPLRGCGGDGLWCGAAPAACLRVIRAGGADPWLSMGEPLSFGPSPKAWSVSCHPYLETEEFHPQNWHWVTKASA